MRYSIYNVGPFINLVIKENKNLKSLLDAWLFQMDLLYLKRDVINGSYSQATEYLSKWAGIETKKINEDFLFKALLFKPFKSMIDRHIRAIKTIKFNNNNLKFYQHRFLDSFQEVSDLFGLKLATDTENQDKYHQNSSPYNINKAIDFGKIAIFRGIKNKEHSETHIWGLFNQEFLSGWYFQEALILKILICIKTLLALWLKI